MFHELLNSNSLPEKDRNVEYLWQEGQNVLGAGSDTVAYVLTIATYYLLADLRLAEELREELRMAREVKGEELGSGELMRLPFLV
jgi:cytochrome P450